MALTLERLRSGGEAFMEELVREQYQAHAGLARSADLQGVYARHAELLGRDALELVLQLYREAEPGTEEHRSARMLLEWQAEAQASRAVVREEEREIAWEASAVVHVGDGRAVPYARAQIETANATDRRERQALDDARAALVRRELAPIRRERMAKEKGFVESLEIAPSYNETFERLSGVPLAALAAECEQFLRDTQAMWDETFPTFVRKSLGIAPAEATRADAYALFRAREFDRYFEAREMEPAVRRQVSEMGIDPTADGRIRFDTGEREGKRARAFCAPVRVPDEVYLVLRPHGGQSDYTTFLHELGHALHFAYMRPSLPFEHRWVGDNSITEGYAMLFDHLTQDAGWLARYTGLGRPQVPAYRRAAGFEELHFLRRYSAKLIYEVQLYGDDVRFDAVPDLYVSTLTRATNFRYQEADAFVDVDPRFYSTRYLQAWQLQAQIAETLRERFDEDWFRNPAAGPWIVGELFGEGQRELAREQAARVSGRELSFAPLVRAIEGMLA